MLKDIYNNANQRMDQAVEHSRTELSKVRKFGQYDVVIDLQGLIKSAIVTKFISSRKIVGFDKNSIRERLSSYFYDQKVAIGYDQNTIVRYVKLISEALSIKITNDDIINKEFYLFSKSKFLIPQTPYIVFVIGSTWQSRNYPKEKFTQVAQAIKKSCIVIWGN